MAQVSHLKDVMIKTANGTGEENKDDKKTRETKMIFQRQLCKAV